MAKRVTWIGVAGLFFLAGWGASDIWIGHRLIVTTMDGDERVNIGVDRMGRGYVVIRDQDGNDLWGYINGKPIGAASAPASVASAPPAATTTLVGQLLSIETIGPDPNLALEADDLIAEGDALDLDASRIEEEEARLADADRDRPRYSDEQDIDRKALREELRMQAADLRSRAKRIRGEARRLKREAEELRQLLRVWAGNMEVTLETTRDLSGVLRRIPQRGFLEWNGVRRTMTSRIAVYEVSSIRAVSRPANFQDAP